MQYRHMGKWGVRLSAIGVGSYLTIGFKLDEETSRATVRAAYDAGVNFFDTANAYNKGGAERMLGKILRDFPRSSFFLITKVFAEMGPGPNDRGLSAKHVFEQCHASLQRLGIDYIDLYMCHRPDPDTPLEETIRVMEDLARQGKILYWGVSEWSAAQMAEANCLARQIGARPIGVNQPRYNLLYRQPEEKVFPLTTTEGIGNVAFSPLAHGMLTGKYQPSKPAPPGTRAADDETNMVIKNLYWKEESRRKSQELVRIAREMGISPATLALAWCLRRTEVTSAIIGATKVSQIQENLKAVDVQIPADVLLKLDSVFPPPTASPAV
ncbi:MAG: aldo/keto reductase family protein [Verrucomicrobia bacterium]|nr:aldo/keto reductase family protein [Verrucomicrobiota bacterium]